MKKPVMHSTWTRVLFLSLLLSAPAISFALVFAQSTDHASQQAAQTSQYSYAEFAKVPENARVRPNPFESDTSAAAAGRKLFQQRCATCHGNTADGGRKGPSLRAPEVRTATPGMIFWIVTNGVVRRGMPVWSKLPEQQRWQIVSYLKSLD